MRREGKRASALPTEEAQSTDFMSDSDTCSITYTPTLSQHSSQLAKTISIMAEANTLDARGAWQTERLSTSTAFQDVQQDQDKPRVRENTNQGSGFATPPPRDANLDETRSNNQPSFTKDIIHDPSKKVYDIETLIKLRGCSGGTTVMLKVKPAAIAGEFSF